MENKKKMEACTKTSTSDGFIVREDEYIKDDIIYCKKCGEPRLYSFENSDKQFVKFPKRVRVICSCEKEELRKKKEEENKQIDIDRYKELQEASLLGERFKDVLFKTTETEFADKSFINAKTRCERFCENYLDVLKNGYGIYIYGNCGCGKTHLVACMVNYLTEKKQPCLFTNFIEISKSIRSTFDKGKESEMYIIERLKNIPFLFIDDIGTEKIVKNGEDNFLQERIYDIINNRYNSKKPTIFTSNLTFQQLVEVQGMWRKTVDRIVEMSSAVIKIEGVSYRLKNRDKKLPF